MLKLATLILSLANLSSPFFQLLDCFSIPTVLVLSWWILRARYKLTHIAGLAVALMSVVTLVWLDIDDGRGGVTAGGERGLERNFLGYNVTTKWLYLEAISWLTCSYFGISR